ncbi:hypothetical protein [Halomonas alkaliantarctica]|uniref:hypothetical protein n=1 Tax=Halomonas alkaliantarctica TaxID=232346 RepID=UPI00265812DC|nr:hypothetical protein [Halomonas alkaliantarctica]
MTGSHTAIHRALRFFGGVVGIVVAPFGFNAVREVVAVAVARQVPPPAVIGPAVDPEGVDADAASAAYRAHVIVRVLGLHLPCPACPAPAVAATVSHRHGLAELVADYHGASCLVASYC